MAVFLALLEPALLASSCSIDAFTASFSYGAKGIQIPRLSNLIISFTSSAIFGISLVFGGVIGNFFPASLTKGFSFTILLIIGAIKLLDSVTASIIRRYNKSNGAMLSREIKFTMFNFSFILNLYANPEDADIDGNKVISPSEAALLSLSLSLDGMAVGFGAALGYVNVPVAVFASVAANITAVFVGSSLGRKLAGKLPFNVSWLGGALLIYLALSRLF